MSPMIRSQISCIRAWSLAIPLRQKFAHAARERRCADPIVVQIELADGTCGYGETLPRDYVTGESRESVLEAITFVFPAPKVVSLRVPSLRATVPSLG